MKDIYIQKPERGDILAYLLQVHMVFNVYNYNKNVRPAVVFVGNGGENSI